MFHISTCLLPQKKKSLHKFSILPQSLLNPLNLIAIIFYNKTFDRLGVLTQEVKINKSTKIQFSRLDKFSPLF